MPGEAVGSPATDGPSKRGSSSSSQPERPRRPGSAKKTRFVPGVPGPITSPATHSLKKTQQGQERCASVGPQHNEDRQTQNTRAKGQTSKTEVGAATKTLAPRLGKAIAELLERYLRERGEGRNLSAYTLRNYRTDLEHFLYALAGWEVDPLKATRTDLRRYLAVLLGNGVAAASVRRKVSTIRSFYKWLRAEEQLSVDPFFGVTGPKVGRRLPDILDANDIARMVASADGKEPADLRDRALMELVYAAGLRVSEVASLDVAELDVRDCSVRVHGKGKKERTGVFGEPAAAALQRYLKHARPELLSHNEEALFLNRFGGRLTPRSVQTIVRKYATKAGLPLAVHPHLLRHSFATHLLDGGADLRVVQELLGHESPNTTQVYTHVTESKKRDVMESALENLGRIEAERSTRAKGRTSAL
jgi:integrase/recombinase XerC